MNTKLLKAIIRRNNDTQAVLAERLGISPSQLNHKINAKTDFKISEVSVIAKEYQLSSEMLTAIFFPEVL